MFTQKGTMGAQKKENDNFQDIQSKLKLVLRTPQGQEISNRNLRISDKYRGGYIHKKKASLLEAEELEHAFERRHSDRNLKTVADDSKPRKGNLSKANSTGSFGAFLKFKKKVAKESKEYKESRESRRELRRRQKEFERYL
mmetsp:Transcript_7148/g.9046  ORF Transcript_7148/g.9046 Transcript_7148/m.9046 type:complete len:141 (+) Transcript_7148:270-692(+)